MREGVCRCECPQVLRYQGHWICVGCGGRLVFGGASWRENVWVCVALVLLTVMLLVGCCLAGRRPARGVSEEMFHQTFKFQKGDWSHVRTP